MTSACPDELFRPITNILGRLSPFLFLLLMSGTVCLMLWAPGIRWRWLKTVVRILGAVVGVAFLFALPALALGFLLASDNPDPVYKILESPQATYQATLMYQAGFLGRDFTTVQITKKDTCHRYTAYEYQGPSSIDETHLTWTDDSHLEIEYQIVGNRPQHCESQVEDVKVACKPYGENR